MNFVKNVVRKQCEDRKQRERKKRRFNGSLELRTVRGRDRERETHRKLNFKIMHSLNVLQMCVFNAHVIYKSFEGLTEVLSYFNALKERLLQIPKYIP